MAQLKKTKNYSQNIENKYPGGVKKKKSLGQNFLRDHSVVNEMIKKVNSKEKTVLEIGCGDGFLTRSILDQSKCRKLICIEFDKEWADVVSGKIKDGRLDLVNQDVLEFDWEVFKEEVPMVLLANLPYNISFPILKKLVKYREHFSEGVFMVQEEVAQKLVATKKGVVGVSLFFQAYLNLELLTKVGPEAFVPSPKVNSRTVYFKVRTDTPKIEKEEAFWDFVKSVFRHSRQTLKNNLKKEQYPTDWALEIDSELLAKRPQHLNLADFLKIWHDNKGCDVIPICVNQRKKKK